MASSTTDRNHRDRVKAFEEDEDEDLFSDPDAETNREEEEDQRAAFLTITSLHLLLMLDSDGCPLERGHVVRFKKEGPSGVIHDWNKVEFGGQIWTSVHSACIQALRAEGRESADTWNQTFIDNPVDPSQRPLNIAAVFKACWRNLGVPLEVLESKEALADLLYEQGKIDAVDRERFKKQDDVKGKKRSKK